MTDSNNENIIIVNQQNLSDFLLAVKKDGFQSLHVLSDFDRTLTKPLVDGQPVPSLISILRDENYLTPDYPAKAKALFAKYHPIEIDPNISLENKKQAMDQWWTTHYELLIASKLTKKDVARAMQSPRLQLRPQAAEFIAFLHNDNIPLVIMSASGLGDELISAFLYHHHLDYPNIHIASNRFIWKNDQAVGFIEPIIHSFSKNEAMLKDYPFYSKIYDRQNVLLLGDGPADVEMINGFAYNKLLKIGFYNHQDDTRLPEFIKNYDIVIRDESFAYINNLIQ